MAARRTARRVLRLAGAILAIVLVALLVAAATAIIVVHTDWGRERVRSAAEDALDDMVHGDVSIGRLEGSVLGNLTLRDIVVRDRQGETVIQIDRLYVDYSLLPLLDQEFHAGELAIDGLDARLRRAEDGSIDLAELLVESEEESQWSADIEDLVVRSATVEVYDAASDRTYRVESIDIAAGVEYDPASWRVGLRGLDASVPALELEATARGDFRGRGERIAARSVRLGAGDSTLAIPFAGVNLATGAGAGTFRLEADAAQLERFAPQVAWNGGAVALGTVLRDEGGPTRVAMRAAASPADVWISGEISESPPALDLAVRLRDVDPAAAGAGVPGQLAFDGQVRATGTGFDDLEATLRGTLRGRVAGVRLDRADIDASLEGQVARANLDITSGRGSARGRAVVDVSGERVVLQQARFQGRVPSLASALPDAGLTGRATFAVTASGPIDALDARATVEATDVRGAGIPIDTLKATVTVDDLERFRARFDAVSGEDLAVHGDVAARSRGALYAVDIRRLRARTHGLTWRVAAERLLVDPGGRVIAEDLTVRSAAASARVSGRVDARGPRLRGAVEVASARADLARLRRGLAPLLPDDLPDISGRVAAHGDVNLGRRAVRGELRADALRWADNPPVEVRVDVDMQDRALDLDAVVANAAVGWAHLEADVEVPRRPTELAAWRQLDRDQLARVALEVRDLDLGRAARLAGLDAEIRGLLEGEIEIEDGGEAMDVDLHIRGGSFQALGRGLNASVSLRSDARETHVEAVAALAGRTPGRATITADIGAGLRALWRQPPGAIPETFLEAPMTAQVRLLRTRLADLGELAGFDPALRGWITAEAELTGTLAAPRGTADLHIDRATVEGIALGEVDVHGELTGTRWEARARLDQPQGGRVVAVAAGPLEGARTVRGRIDATDIRVRPLAALAGYHALGRLRAEVRFEGPLAKPQVRGEAQLRGGMIEGLPAVERLTDVRLDVRMDERELRFSASAESLDGSIEVDGTGLLADYYPTRVTALVRAEEMPMYSGGQLVEVTTEARVRADIDDLVLVDVEILGGEVVAAENLGDVELHPTGPLEDVVYVDERDDARPPDGTARDPIVRADIVTTEPVRVRQPGTVKTAITADLRVTLLESGETPIEGRVETVGGEVMLMERRYEVARGRLDFTGRLPANPDVDVRLIHDFDEMTLIVIVGGTLDDPEVELRSQPATYERETLLAILLGAEPDRAEDEIGLRQGAAKFASAAAARGLSDLLGGPKLLDVALGADEGEDGVSYVDVGRWVTEDLFIAYRRRFQDDQTENANEVMVEWRILDNWLIEATAGDRGQGSADILWVYRF